VGKYFIMDGSGMCPHCDARIARGMPNWAVISLVVAGSAIIAWIQRSYHFSDIYFLASLGVWTVCVFIWRWTFPMVVVKQ
jgi:hypothetical protein